MSRALVYDRASAVLKCENETGSRWGMGTSEVNKHGAGDGGWGPDAQPEAVDLLSGRPAQGGQAECVRWTPKRGEG